MFSAGLGGITGAGVLTSDSQHWAGNIGYCEDWPDMTSALARPFMFRVLSNTVDGALPPELLHRNSLSIPPQTSWCAQLSVNEDGAEWETERGIGRGRIMSRTSVLVG